MEFIIEPKMNGGLERTSCNCSTGWKTRFNYKMRVYFLEFFPALCKEAAHRFYFRKLGFFSELISTWAAEWTVSRGLSILTDLQKQTQGSTPSAIRRPPLPTTYLPKTPLLRNNARARDVHLTKAASPPAVWTGDKRRFNRWSSPQLVVCQREAGYQITSKICLSPNNGISRPFFTE